MGISTRIKEYIDKEFDGNDSALAKKLDMLPQTLYQYTKGKSIPGGILLTKLAELGCNINWLLLGEEGVSKVRERSAEYSTELSGIKQELAQLKEEMQSVKAMNYDLIIKCQKLEKERDQALVSEAQMRGRVLQLDSVNDKLEKNGKMKA